MIESLLAAALPLAAIGELVSVVLFILWIARQVMSGNDEAKQIREAQREMPPVDDEGAPLEDDPVRNELEAFLARVREQQEGAPDGGMRAEPVRAEVAPGGRVIEVFDDDPEDFTPTRRPVDPFEEPARDKPSRPERLQPPRRTQPLRQTEPQRDGREPAPPQPVARSEASRADSHELRHLPESQLAEHAAHLGEGIAGADDRVQARLEAKFGKFLDQSPATTHQAPADPATNAAARIAAALSSPGGVRDAIVLNEILQRPVDRW